MTPVAVETRAAICAELALHPWRHAELAKHLARSGYAVGQVPVTVRARSFETEVSQDDGSDR